MDPVLEKLADYGWAVILLYIALRELSGLLKTWLPAEVKRRQVKDELDARLIEEDAAREDDLKERQVVATESISKSLVILQNNQGHQISLLDHLSEGVNQTNSGIAILLDRKQTRKA